MQLIRVSLELCEPLFFATKEVGAMYITEPFVGNYALAYATGIEITTYKRKSAVSYTEDLPGTGFYCTPAQFKKFGWTSESFNSVGESRYLLMDKNNYKSFPEEKTRAANIPQIGTIKMIASESRAEFYVLKNTNDALPKYIRLGKFNTKARLDFEEMDYEVMSGHFECSVLLNPADLPDIQIHSFRSNPVKPVPLLKSLKATGKYINSGDISLPYGMSYCRRLLSAN
ncbi:type I-D CRISPR-associated protein Cas5/Csc1 [Mesotoga prima]|uniref:type I-D CRISPR-associated protein Cas5/Csc1 n=1 Tax=Mesotoga prima TaxID=1184387 RepID=UPI001BD49C11|nr:type I-D CRISPR-associated protein Cas5/Csc1 [Mesotoga prima]HQC15870.1 type I-D CRISPR-associated protein Cas5/Csc1 [Mesotoga prima]